MIVLDYSILYQVVLFVVLWLILSKVLFRPYLNLLEERERKTTGAEHDSAELEHEAAQLKAEYDARIARAQAAGYAAREAIVQGAREEREKILLQARDEAAAALSRQRAEIAAATERERELAATEVAEAAASMASKVLGRPVA